MPYTNLTEDVIKDVTEGLLEKLEGPFTPADLLLISTYLQSAAAKLWKEYQGRPYMKVRRNSKNGGSYLVVIEKPTLSKDVQLRCTATNCGCPQRNTPSGQVCKNGHGGAPGQCPECQEIYSEGSHCPACSSENKKETT